MRTLVICLAAILPLAALTEPSAARAAGPIKSGQKHLPQQTRKIAFPRQFSLGALYSVEKPDSEQFLLRSEIVQHERGKFLGEAQGILTVTAGRQTQIYLFPSYKLVEHPEVLKQVDPSAFDCITLNTVATMEAIDKIMPYLKHLTGLKRLELAGAELTDEQVGSLQSFKNLESLDLAANAIHGSCLKDLPLLPRFIDLNVSMNDLNAEAFAYLGQIKNIAWLDVGRTRADDRALERLSHLQKVAYLGMRGNNFSARGITLLNKMRALKHVDLTGVPVSLNDLLPLKASTLKEINLPGGHYTKAELEILNKALPNISNLPLNQGVDKETQKDFGPLH